MEEIKTQKDVVGITKDYERDNLRFFYPDEYFKFFSVIPNSDHAFWFEFLFQTGMRYGEARAIKIEDINFERRQITVKHSEKAKKRKQRRVFFNNQFKAKMLQRINYNKLKKEDTFNFPSKAFMNRVIKFYGSKAGLHEVRDLKTHTCRKTHETFLLALGIPDMTISLHMGHSVDTALRYYVSACLNEDEVSKVNVIMGDIFPNLKK